MASTADKIAHKTGSPSTRRVGVEVELLAPPLVSRRRLADEIAVACDGEVSARWHVGLDETRHREFGRFHHLAPAFDVVDSSGRPVVRIVDDVTILADLDAGAPPARGWRRLLASNPKWLKGLRPFLSPVGELDVGVDVAAVENGLTFERRSGVVRFIDDKAKLVAEFAGVHGERYRVAECISPPLRNGVVDWFDLVVGTAGRLGFTTPTEGATHIHLDAEQFRNPTALRRLVEIFAADLTPIRQRFATNPNCSRLGQLDVSLLELVESADYATLSWAQIAERARATKKLTKYCDVNLQHLLARVPKIDTVEFRMLPSTLDSDSFAGMLSGVDGLVDSIVYPS